MMYCHVLQLSSFFYAYYLIVMAHPVRCDIFHCLLHLTPVIQHRSGGQVRQTITEGSALPIFPTHVLDAKQGT